GNMPTVDKNLLCFHGVFLLATVAMPSLTRLLGAYKYDSPYFEHWQIVSHMFMHGSFMLICFHMFPLWMFGTAIERVWGPKKFLIYYFVTGFGAFVLHYAIIAWQVNRLVQQLGPEALEIIKTQGIQLWLEGINYTDPLWGELNAFY